MNTVDVAIMRLAHAHGIELPQYATAGAAGVDLPAAVTDPLIVAPTQRTAVPTGLCLALPPGYEGQIRPRSGLALRSGVTVLNSPGTIDSDYRGEVMVILINHGDQPFTVSRGDRIAQLVIMPVGQANWIEATDIDETDRGAQGFGSTGRSASISPLEVS